MGPRSRPRWPSCSPTGLPPRKESPRPVAHGHYHCQRGRDDERLAARSGTGVAEITLAHACSAPSNRVVRTRMLRGVGGSRSNPPAYPILAAAYSNLLRIQSGFRRASITATTSSISLPREYKKETSSTGHDDSQTRFHGCRRSRRATRCRRASNCGNSRPAQATAAHKTNSLRQHRLQHRRKY
jgi:hypothetical protein